jgi:hypothetical protein
MPGLDPGIHDMDGFLERGQSKKPFGKSLTERGTHQSLLAAKGSYAAPWTKRQKERAQETPVPTD